MAQEATMRGKRKQRKGVVIRDSVDKTTVVKVERVLRHPVYGKVVRTHKKYHVHDEQNQAREGDRVTIVETRPLSKRKRWRIIDASEDLTDVSAAEEINDTDADQA